MVARTLVPCGAPSLPFSSPSSSSLLGRSRGSPLTPPGSLCHVTILRPYPSALTRFRPFRPRVRSPRRSRNPCPSILLSFTFSHAVTLLDHSLTCLFRSYIFFLSDSLSLSLPLSVGSCASPDLFSLLLAPFSRVIGDKASGSCPSI